MKKWLAGAFGCICMQLVVAQKTELTVEINGTASFFRGADAASFSGIYVSDVPGAIPNSTSNYYGKKAGLGFGAGATIQHIGKRKFITGISAGYEQLTSRVNITEVYSRLRAPANGTTKLTHTFINFFPFVGRRFGSTVAHSSGDAFDINLGLDVAIPIAAYEKGEAQVSGGSTYTTDIDHHKPAVDIRPRLQLKVQKNRIGLQTSFSVGTINYYGRLNGGNPEAYLNVFRVGIFYVL